MTESEAESLFGQYGPVTELELDEALEEHLKERGITEKHIVSFTEIREVFQGDPRFFGNPPGSSRRAPAVMVGPTLGGRFLTVPIEPTGKWGIWRPITAFTSNAHHIQRYGREINGE